MDATSDLAARFAALRPELHRYCARLMGSIVDGEDIVQETLTRAHQALLMSDDPPPLRPFLFRIAHNAAIDALRRHERRFTDAMAEVPDPDDPAAHVDPAVVHLALAVFHRLPLAQRSVVILKDVLGCTLEEIAESTGMTVLAIKAALVRGRRALREHAGDPVPAPPADRDERARLHAYAAKFNARDWEGLRALIGDDTRLDLVARAGRRGAAVGEYYTRYAANPSFRVVTGLLDGRPALAMYEPADAATPTSFIVITWADDARIGVIRDFRYATYAAELAASSFVADDV
jgi:RNA polymerase sigma-70 factor (ECF subfamily)